MDMSPIIWNPMSNGSDDFEYVSLTSETIEGALNVARKGFFVHESACVAIGVPAEPEAIKELEELVLRTAKDGVSLVAIEKSTGKVVGVAFNKLQVKNSSEEGTYFENFIKSCKHSSSKALVQFMVDADAACDLFELCQVDCLLEIMFLATLPEYRGRKIAENLTRISIDLAKKLSLGKNVKQSFQIGKEMCLQPVPKVVSALFTSVISQKIGRKLNMNKAATISYERFNYNGKTFFSVIGHITKNCTLEYLKL